MATSKNKSSVSKTAGEGKRFGIVVSRYHQEITQALLDGAMKTLTSHGAAEDQVTTVWVPGSFEIPLAARAMTQQGLDAVICLGVVIKGETKHDEYIAREVAHGIAQLSAAAGVPVIFGVLTVDKPEQAKARAGGDQGHKGIEAAESALVMLEVLEQIKKLPGKSSKSVGFGF
jgi:6,7-dimethyl-8-ribityllumazine synthase